MPDCPCEQQLMAFHVGTLAEAEVERVAEHLEACPQCEAAVERLDAGGDPLLDALRHAPPAASNCASSYSGRQRGALDFDDGAGAWPDLPGYEILGVLGRGGMGIVYKARQVSLNRLVGLKRLRIGSQKEAARSRAEAEALGRLQHPYIVQIHEVIEHQGWLYLALEFVAGGSLISKLTGKPQPSEAVADLMELVARAVHHAHLNGIVHRDLKPANVLLACGTQESELREASHGSRSTAYGLPKIADFGLAKWLAGGSGHTEHGDVLGTANYMAPEQAAGRLDRIGPATDIYSLGVMLYEMLTGRVPLQGTTTLETLALVRDEDPPPPRLLQPHVPRDLETICLKCLAKEPAGRYSSAAAMADDLHRYLHHEPILARRSACWERGLKLARRRPAVAALSLALALLGVSAFAAVTWQWQRYEQIAAEEQLARKAVEANARQVERLSVSMMLDRAAALCESGELAAGLLWAAEALEASARIGDADLERVARLNLAAWRPLLVRQRAEPSALGGVSAIALNSAGTVLATGGPQGAAQRWSLATGEALGEPMAHDGPVHSVAYSPDGKLIATASGSPSGGGEARLWNAMTGGAQGASLKLVQPISMIAFCSAGDAFVTVCPDEAQLWNTTDRTPIGAPMKHGPASPEDPAPNRPMTAVVSPDGALIATGGRDQMVRIWNAQTAEPVGEPLEATHAVVALAFSPDSQMLLAGSADGGVRMWNAKTGQRRGESLKMRGVVYAVAFSPDGQLAAAAGAVGDPHLEPAGEVQLCQVETGQNLGAALAHPRPVRTLAFSPGGRLLLTGCEDGQARFYLTATGALADKPLFHEAPLRAMAFTPDGLTAVTTTAEATKPCVRLWHAPRERSVGRPLVLPGELASVAFDADGRSLSAFTRDGSTRTWKLAAETREELPFEHVRGAAAGDDRKSRGAEHVLHADNGRTAYSPDRSMFIEAGANQTARLRDAATGKTLGPPLERDDVSSAAFSADGSHFAVGGFDGRIALWEAWSPIEGSPELVRVTIELVTGMQWVSHELVGDLSADELEYRRRRLKELSGSPQRTQ